MESTKDKSDTQCEMEEIMRQ